MSNNTILPQLGIDLSVWPRVVYAVAAEAAVIAWKDIREAWGAVADVLPFHTAASRVRVVALESNDHTTRRQGIDDVGGADEAEALIQIADEHRADLLVCGAYGHSWIREWVFGGVSRVLLRSPAINRLMSN